MYLRRVWGLFVPLLLRFYYAVGDCSDLNYALCEIARDWRTAELTSIHFSLSETCKWAYGYEECLANMACSTTDPAYWQTKAAIGEARANLFLCTPWPRAVFGDNELCAINRTVSGQQLCLNSSLDAAIRNRTKKSPDVDMCRFGRYNSVVKAIFMLRVGQFSVYNNTVACVEDYVSSYCTQDVGLVMSIYTAFTLESEIPANCTLYVEALPETTTVWRLFERTTWPRRVTKKVIDNGAISVQDIQLIRSLFTVLLVLLITGVVNLVNPTCLVYDN